MLNFFRRYKVLAFLLIALFIIVPFLVMAVGTTLNGYPILKNQISEVVFWNTNNNAASIVATSVGTCINNTSSNDYFVPTRTWSEWSAFVNNKPSGVSLKTCCGDGACQIAPASCYDATDPADGTSAHIPCNSTPLVMGYLPVAGENYEYPILNTGNPNSCSGDCGYTADIAPKIEIGGPNERYANHIDFALAPVRVMEGNTPPPCDGVPINSVGGYSAYFDSGYLSTEYDYAEDYYMETYYHICVRFRLLDNLPNGTYADASASAGKPCISAYRVNANALSPVDSTIDLFYGKSIYNLYTGKYTCEPVGTRVLQNINLDSVCDGLTPWSAGWSRVECHIQKNW